MSSPFSEKRHHALLDSLYLAPFETRGWSGFLEQLVNWSGSRSARMLVLNSDADRVLSSVQVNTDRDAYQAYVDHFVNLCPWRPELKDKAPGQLYSTYTDFSCKQDAFYQTEFFNDWARPLDIHHGACGTVTRYADLTIQLLVQRTGGQGHYGGDDMRQINALLPHVRRALRLEAARWREHHRHAVLESPQRSNAMLLIDPRGRLAYVSDDAQRYLNDDSLFAVRDGCLRLQQHAKQRDFQRVLGQILASPGKWDTAGEVLLLERPDLSTLRLLVMPLHPEARDEGLFPVRSHAAVFIIDVDAEVQIDEALLAQLFALTAAEARAAAMVARGNNPTDIARLCNISVHTARSQLKTIFRKTGTSSQSRLTSLILGSPATRKTGVSLDLEHIVDSLAPRVS
jgi:DNA-binding CsgD family transcriptional regulator